MKKLFIKIILFCCPYFSFAQEIKFHNSLHLFTEQKITLMKSDSVANFLFAFSLKPGYIFHTAPPQTFENCFPAITNGVHYTAFFCKMENRLRERFNIWIKFRAGDDESYRKMTEER